MKNWNGHDTPLADYAVKGVPSRLEPLVAC
jgi:hypothetical protein